MTALFSSLDRIRERITPPVCAFLEGKLYPIILGTLVVIGHVSGLEFYFNIPIMASAYLALLLCRGIRAFLPALLMLLYQINYTHAFSDYYFTGPVFVILIIQVSLLALCFIFYFVRNVAPNISPRSPLFYPLIALCAAFLLGGAFTEGWVIKNLYYALLQIFAYALIFYTVYYGLAGEDHRELMEYLTLLASVVAMVIAAELAAIYFSGTVAPEGEIIKENVHLGWGMWNPIGFCLTVLIPLIMRGAIAGRYRTLYLIIGILTWVAAIFSMSRNAQLFSTLTMAACVIIGSVRGERRILFRILLGIGIAGAIGICVLLHDRLLPLISAFLYDNGRFELWGTALDNFLASPIIGKGFYGFGRGNVFAAFLPWLAHNTVLEMLSATGILGTGAYLVYRACTLRPFIKEMSRDKLMLLLPILVTLAMSLIDNYVFHVYTTFVYSICLAAAHRLADGQQEKK